MSRRRGGVGAFLAIVAAFAMTLQNAGAVATSSVSIIAVPSGAYTKITKLIRVKNIPQVPSPQVPSICKKLGCDQPPPQSQPTQAQAASDCSGGCWEEGFGMVWAYRTDGTKVAYRWASGSHYKGSAQYSHHAHGALIRGWDYEGDLVWSSFNNPCASATGVNNPEIKTCGSQDFNTQHGGKWLIIGGFWYDHYNDGNADWECPGCIDQRWAVP